MNKRNILHTALAAAVALTLASCSKKEETPPKAPEPAAPKGKELVAPAGEADAQETLKNLSLAAVTSILRLV